jgi:hypothetical protein
MFRKLKLATVIAVALSTVVTMDSTEAHIGARGGGGIRLGGGGALIPRARPQGNLNGNRGAGNNGVAGRAVPAPAPKPAAPPIVQIGGAKSTKPAVPSTNTNKPSSGTVISNNGAITSNAPKSTTNNVQSPIAPAQAPAPAPEPQPKKPVNSKEDYTRHLIFNLTGDAAPEETIDAPAVKGSGLSLEARQALEETLADAPAAESTPAEVASKEVVAKEASLPQIPVGATLTLNGKDLSDKEGQVMLQIGEIALPATITEWKNNLVTCTLPVLGLTKSSKATIHVLKADGKTASMLNCELVTPTVPSP